MAWWHSNWKSWTPAIRPGWRTPNMDLANQHWLTPIVLVTNPAHQKMITLCVTCQVNHSTRNLTFCWKPNKGWWDPSPILLLSRCQWHQGGGWWAREADDGWSETHQSWFWDAETDPPPPNCKQFTSKRLIILNTQQFMPLLNNPPFSFALSLDCHCPVKLNNCGILQTCKLRCANLKTKLLLKSNAERQSNLTQLSNLYTTNAGMLIFPTGRAYLTVSL